MKLYTCTLTVKRLFAGIYWLLDKKSTGKMEFRRDYWRMDIDSDRQDQKSSDSNNSRNINSKLSLPRKTNFKKFKYEY
jgi:hypothetical protein